MSCLAVHCHALSCIAMPCLALPSILYLFPLTSLTITDSCTLPLVSLPLTLYFISFPPSLLSPFFFSLYLPPSLHLSFHIIGVYFPSIFPGTLNPPSLLPPLNVTYPHPSPHSLPPYCTPPSHPPSLSTSLLPSSYLLLTLPTPPLPPPLFQPPPHPLTLPLLPSFLPSLLPSLPLTTPTVPLRVRQIRRISFSLSLFTHLCDDKWVIGDVW